MSEKKERKKYVVCEDRYESARPARHARPVDHLPGSTAKIEEMARRYEKRQALHAPGDTVDVEGLRLRLRKAGNNHLVPDRESALGEVADEREALKNSEKSSPGNFKKLSAPSPGDRIREARLKSGLSAKRASLLMGLSQNVLGQLERREIAPSLWIICLAAQHLRVDPDYLACLDADEAGTVSCLCS